MVPGQAQQDTIHWRQDYKLKWDDFQGKPDMNSDNRAITVVDVGYDLSFTKNKFDVTVSCVFMKKKSWKKEEDSVRLAHEQGHFDIAEIFARKLRMAFRSYVFNSKTISSDFRSIFSKLYADKEALDSLYDKETDFSRNRSMQLIWNKKILTELHKLDPYKE